MSLPLYVVRNFKQESLDPRISINSYAVANFLELDRYLLFRKLVQYEIIDVVMSKKSLSKYLN